MKSLYNVYSGISYPISQGLQLNNESESFMETSLEFHVASDSLNQIITIAKRVAREKFPTLVEDRCTIYPELIDEVKDSKDSKYGIRLTKNEENRRGIPSLYQICTNVEYFADKETSKKVRQQLIKEASEFGADIFPLDNWRLKIGGIYDFHMAFYNLDEIARETRKILREKYGEIDEVETMIFPKAVKIAEGLDRKYYVSLEKK